MPNTIKKFAHDGHFLTITVQRFQDGPKFQVAALPYSDTEGITIFDADYEGETYEGSVYGEGTVPNFYGTFEEAELRREILAGVLETRRITRRWIENNLSTINDLMNSDFYTRKVEGFSVTYSINKILIISEIRTSYLDEVIAGPFNLAVANEIVKETLAGFMLAL